MAADVADDLAGTARGEVPEWVSLDDDETIEWADNPAQVSMISGIIWGIILTPLFGIGLLVIASAVLTVRNTNYVATDKALYVKRGVLSTNIESVGLDKIQNTEFKQTFWGKQFGYGSIDVSTAGSSGAEITFRAVENAQEVRELIDRLSTQFAPGARSRTERTEAAAPDEDPMAELLAELTATREALENVERALRAREGDPLAEAPVTGADVESVGSVGENESGDGATQGERSGRSTDADDPSDGTDADDPSDGADVGEADWSTGDDDPFAFEDEDAAEEDAGGPDQPDR